MHDCRRLETLCALQIMYAVLCYVSIIGDDLGFSLEVKLLLRFSGLKRRTAKSFRLVKLTSFQRHYERRRLLPSISINVFGLFHCDTWLCLHAAIHCPNDHSLSFSYSNHSPCLRNNIQIFTTLICHFEFECVEIPILFFAVCDPGGVAKLSMLTRAWE